MALASCCDFLEDHATIVGSIGSFCRGCIILSRSRVFHVKLRLEIDRIVAALCLLVLVPGVLLLTTTPASCHKCLLQKFISVGRIVVAVFDRMVAISIRRSEGLKLAITCLD